MDHGSAPPLTLTLTLPLQGSQPQDVTGGTLKPAHCVTIPQLKVTNPQPKVTNLQLKVIFLQFKVTSPQLKLTIPQLSHYPTTLGHLPKTEITFPKPVTIAQFKFTVLQTIRLVGCWELYVMATCMVKYRLVTARAHDDFIVLPL